VVKKYNNLSFLFFIPGMIAQIAVLAITKGEIGHAFDSPIPAVLLVGGTALAFIGFGYYAKAKGRSMAWGLVAFIGLPGLLVLSILKDRSGDPWNT
jgi:hypothetical protein